MQKKRRLLLDVDGVLGDFQTPALDLMFEKTGRRYQPHDFENWDIFPVLSEEERTQVFAEIERPGFCASLKPFPEAQEAITELRGLVDIYIVTSPWPSPTWAHERDIWLKDFFRFTSKQIVHTSAKYLVKGDALLDDKPDHIVSWTAEYPDGLGMLWHIPNTRKLGHDHLRVHSWETVIQKVKAL